VGSSMRLAQLAVRDVGLLRLFKMALSDAGVAGRHMPSLLSNVRVIGGNWAEHASQARDVALAQAQRPEPRDPTKLGVTAVRFCAHCGKRGYLAEAGDDSYAPARSPPSTPQYHRLRRCMRCESAYYCDRDTCQRPDWRASHRIECTPIKGDAVAYALPSRIESSSPVRGK
jgi:hypothetical protein